MAVCAGTRRSANRMSVLFELFGPARASDGDNRGCQYRLDKNVYGQFDLCFGARHGRGWNSQPPSSFGQELAHNRGELWQVGIDGVADDCV
jgi:hypothetical protein